MDAFKSIGDSFKSDSGNIDWGKILTTGAGVTGGISNIFATNRQNDLINQEIKAQKDIQSLATDPAKLSARIAALEKPLDASLVQNVGNEVQGYLGQRGLGQSPAIAEQILSQALAPYKLQEQQNAINALMSVLRGEESVKFPNVPQSNIANLLKMITALRSGSGDGSGAIPDIGSPTLDVNAELAPLSSLFNIPTSVGVGGSSDTAGESGGGQG